MLGDGDGGGSDGHVDKGPLLCWNSVVHPVHWLVDNVHPWDTKIATVRQCCPRHATYWSTTIPDTNITSTLCAMGGYTESHDSGLCCWLLFTPNINQTVLCPFVDLLAVGTMAMWQNKGKNFWASNQKNLPCSCLHTNKIYSISICSQTWTALKFFWKTSQLWCPFSGMFAEVAV